MRSILNTKYMQHLQIGKYLSIHINITMISIQSPDYPMLSLTAFWCDKFKPRHAKTFYRNNQSDDITSMDLY